ncbi:MAG: hypothetical protein EBU70_09020 [Actinobacteria bacterium]|nr:hypothetical protein [Actinomycetota bacterium]
MPCSRTHSARRAACAGPSTRRAAKCGTTSWPFALIWSDSSCVAAMPFAGEQVTETGAPGGRSATA